MIELDTLPWIPAKWYTHVKGKRAINKIVIHTMEASEGPRTAENVANYFANLPATRKASAHFCIDNNSIVACVSLNNVAYHAPGANHDGVGIELAGFASQTYEQWHDDYSHTMLFSFLCPLLETLCLAYSIPVRFLTAEEMVRDPQAKGITTHVEVNRAYKQSSHWDPGPNFPMNEVLDTVNELIEPEPPVMSKQPAFPGTFDVVDAIDWTWYRGSTAIAVVTTQGYTYCFPPSETPVNIENGVAVSGPGGQPYFAGRTVHHIEALGNGYSVVATSGERYDYGV